MYDEVKKESDVLKGNLYSKLYYLSKVYDNPQGLSITQILELLGNVAEENEVRNLLDEVKWTTYVGNNTYLFAQKVVSVIEIQKKLDIIEDFDKEQFIQVLMSRYRNGMQFDSIDFDNFRDVYFDMWNEKIEFDDEELEKRLRCCGLVYKGRLFPAEGIIDENTKKKLFEYIENNFSHGKKVLYYTVIYADLADTFVYCFNLTDVCMLKAYIKFADDKNRYFFFEDYMSKEENIEINQVQEITDYILSEGKPLSYEEIYAGVSHLSKELVYREIQRNSDFIRDAKEHYFHEDIFEISDDELNNISEIIKNEIRQNGYAIWANIYKLIEINMPIFIENNLYLSSLGIRNALERLLHEKYNFECSIICDYGKILTMSDVYRLYAEHHPKFTYEDIYCFSKEVDSIIYFPVLYEKVIRVSKNLFVSKDFINLNVETIDAAIETYFSGDYIPIKDIDSFLVFPYEGYEWNEFLLEGYLVSYSKKFMLVNNGFSLKNAAGAVIRRSSSIHSFEDICACALAQNDVELKKDKALDYLVDINFITRKSYKHLESAISQATRMRNRKD